MKKLLFTLLICLLIGVSNFACALDIENGYISINSSAIKELPPNQAEISFTIQTSDKSMKNASDENSRTANKVYTALKSLLGANDYIKTGQFSARPEYIYTKDNKRVLDKFVVTNSVVVKTKNILIVPKLIDAAVLQGATGIDNMNFTAVDYEDVCTDSYADLTKKSFTQASKIAKSINSQILGVKSIVTSCTTENQYHPYYPMMAKAVLDTASGASTPIESGKIRLNININSTFYVK